MFQATEGESPSSVAYDTPSPKLLAFLKKHYGALLSAPSWRHVTGAPVKTPRLPLFRASEASKHRRTADRNARKPPQAIVTRLKATCRTMGVPAAGQQVCGLSLFLGE